MKFKFTSEYTFEADDEQEAYQKMSDEMRNSTGVDDLYEVEQLK